MICKQVKAYLKFLRKKNMNMRLFSLSFGVGSSGLVVLRDLYWQCMGDQRVSGVGLNWDPLHEVKHLILPILYLSTS